MELIDKAPVVAEIKKRTNEYPCDNSEQDIGYHCALYEMQDFLNTLETKEVDLEKEIKSWLDHGHITDTRYDDYDDNDIESTAKHFFELGLKAKK